VSEIEVVKEALKKKYLENIAKKLFEEAKGRIQFPEDISVNDKGKLSFEHIDDNQTLRILISYLANELADAKAELWLQSQTVKKS